MKKRFFKLFSIALITVMLLSACQLRNRSFQGGTAGQTPVAFTVATQAAPTSTQLPSPLPTQTPTATPVPPTAEAAKVAQDYFNDLHNGSFDQASQLISQFSLAVYNMTRSDVSFSLNSDRQMGGSWSDFRLLETSVFDPNTMLVHVQYTYTSQDAATNKMVPSARDELWPMRLEVGQWHYNWNNLIDFRTLNVAAQTVAGITVLPQKLMRYTDRIQLVMLMQNATSQPFVFGQPNEILATFHFGDKTVEAQKTQIILEPLRSTPDVAFDIPGLYHTFPDSVEIRKWINYNTPPWYVFNLQS